MLKSLTAFVLLSRPHFLAGGLILYALGALVARYEGAVIRWPIYWLGQLVVTSIQLMTHYVNEYWDIDTDRLNHNRTFFSGGSGVLVDSAAPLNQQTALFAAFMALGVGVATLITLSGLFQTGLRPWIIFGLAVTGAWFYSSPPLALVNTGFGELVSALIVSILVPALGYLLQTERLSFELVATTLPLALINWVMVTTFEFPDYTADAAVGKRTILVRLGHLHTHSLIAVIILIAYSLIAILTPQRPLALLALPIALIVVILLRTRTRYGLLTFSALAMFGLTSLLQVLIFLWSQPNH